MNFSITRDKQYRCCFCLHVRTGTIFLGVAQILLQLCVILAIIFLSLKRDMFTENDSILSKYVLMNGNNESHKSSLLSALIGMVSGVTNLPDESSSLSELPSTDRSPSNHISSDFDSNLFRPTGISTSDSGSVDSTKSVTWMSPNESPRFARHRRHYSPFFELCLNLFSLSFCCLLVHGAVNRLPTHLLPFFCLQVFDFVVNLLTIVGLMSSKPDVCIWLRMKNDTSTVVTSVNLTFFMIAVYCMVLGFKAYCLGMVWDCYKYLMSTNCANASALAGFSVPRGAETGLNESGSATGQTGHTARFALLPDLFAMVLGLRPPLSAATSTSSSRMGRRVGPRASRGGVVVGLDYLDDVDMLAAMCRSENQAPGAALSEAACVKKPDDLPAYEDALHIPINAHAPPPYFKPSTGKTDSCLGNSSQATTSNASVPTNATSCETHTQETPQK